MNDDTGSAAARSAAPPPLLHDQAPDFVTRTTMGERRLSGYRGRWLLFFSHPADFTPVCTSEFIAFARACPKFKAAGCELLALSVDSLFSHLAWARSIHQQFGVEIPFPIAEDPGLHIAHAYGMVHPSATSSATVRAVFVIDPLGVIRAITWYPMTSGRNVGELLRLVLALQASDEHAALTPENWQPGDPMLDAVARTYAEATSAAGREGAADWYYHVQARPAAKPSLVKP
jgi:peroxiredoxin (alkyl hydroperoxide reductase subunit C)